jgi:hypothetical protein
MRWDPCLCNMQAQLALMYATSHTMSSGKSCGKAAEAPKKGAKHLQHACSSLPGLSKLQHATVHDLAASSLPARLC